MVRYITALILCAALVAGCHNDAPANDTTRTTTSKVVPIDKMSVVITLILAMLTSVHCGIQHP